MFAQPTLQTTSQELTPPIGRGEPAVHPYLRQANLVDIPALTNLIDLAVRTLSAGDYSPQQIDSALKHLFGVDSQLIQDGAYYVMEVQGQIVGAGGWSRRRMLYGSDQARMPGRDHFLDPTREAAKIRAFYVHPQWARRGIGSRLMETCIAAAEQAGFHRLELVATLTGVSLYTRFAFQEVEQLQLTLLDGVCFPAVKMIKTLCED